VNLSRASFCILFTLSLAACTFTGQQDISPLPVDFASRPTNGKTIALLGATGMVGDFVMREALHQGYAVRVLARSPEKLNAVKDHITIVKGDARDIAALRIVLTGSDAIISALGPVKADGNAAHGLSTLVTGHIVRLMSELNINRYIVVSGAAVNIPTDHRNLMGWLIETLAKLAYWNVAQDKQAEYELLAESSANWTLLRCPVIDREPFRNNAIATLDTPHAFNVRAGEVAQFIIEQIDSSEFVRKGPFLGSE